MMIGERGRNHIKSLNVLTDLVQRYPEEVWPEIGQRVLRDPGRHRFAWIAREAGLLSMIPPEVAIQWIQQHGPAGAQLIAALTAMRDANLSNVERFFLMNYSEEATSTSGATLCLDLGPAMSPRTTKRN
jgi:hypothetical protein